MRSRNIAINSPEFRRISPDVLLLTQGGGCVSLFGIPFLGAGIFMLLIVLRVLRVENAAELPFFAWVILSFMGIAFTAAGGALVFGRSWLSLDRRGDRLSKVWGLIRPLRQTDYILSDYTALLIRFKAGDSDSADQYCLSLRNRAGSGELALACFTDYGKALDQASFVREFLDIILEDLTTDHALQTKSQGTFQSLSTSASPIAPPAQMRSVISMEGDRLSVSFAQPQNLLFRVIRFAIPGLVLVFFVIPLFTFFRQSGTPPQVVWFFGGFILLFFVLIPLFSALRRASGKLATSKLSLDHAGLKLRRQGVGGELSFPLAELVGLDYSTRESALNAAQAPSGEAARYSQKLAWLAKLVPSKGIIIKTRREFHYFGAGLPDDEIIYLHQELSRHLAALQNPST